MGLFFSGKDWGTRQSRRKAQCTSYLESFNENPVQSIQNLRLGRMFTFQQDNGPKHTARVAYRQPLSGPATAWAWAWIKYLLRNLKMCICPHPTWKSLRGEQVRWRMADICQMLMSKSCHIISKNTWGCKGVSPKYWVKGTNVYFSFSIFYKFTKLWHFCFWFVIMVYGE